MSPGRSRAIRTYYPEILWVGAADGQGQVKAGKGAAPIALAPDVGLMWVEWKIAKTVVDDRYVALASWLSVIDLNRH